MKLLILYTKSREEIFNRKSALGSYINYLGSLLNSNGFEVFLNGEEIDNRSTEKSESLVSNNKLLVIKKMIPKYIKRYIKERNHLVGTEKFKVELLKSNQKYDVILEYYNMGSDIGMELAKHQEIPYFLFYDGPIIDEYKIFNNTTPFFFNKIIKRQKESFKYANKIVAQSLPMKKYIGETITDGKVDNIYIHQNVDYTKFDILKEERIFNSNPINIGFIGSFLPWHQVEFLLYAFKFILNKGVNANLFLIGDGMEKEKMESIVNGFNESVKSKIKFTGFVKETELLNFKVKIDIGVMPGSNWYGAPLKIFEYGAMKMGVIAPDTPTIMDLFPNNEVQFFKWKNQESLNQTLFIFSANLAKMKSQADKLHPFIMAKYSAKSTSYFYTDFLK